MLPLVEINRSFIYYNRSDTHTMEIFQFPVSRNIY